MCGKNNVRRRALQLACLGLLGSIAACDGETLVKPSPLSAPPKTFVDRIVFSGFPPCDCPVSLWSARVDGTDIRLLRAGFNWPSWPSVSPDGRYVVFGSRSDLFVVNADGVTRALQTPLNHPETPQWSPVEDWILFAADDPIAQFRQIYQVRPDGSALTRLTDPARGPAADPAWSPNGRAIVFVRGWPPESVVILDLVTGLERTVRDASLLNARGPAWSPDGRYITFMDHDSVLNDAVITRLDLSTLQYAVLGSAEGNRAAKWSPDGTALLFGTDDLWLMNPDGTGRRRLVADTMIYFDGTWGPSSAVRRGSP